MRTIEITTTQKVTIWYELAQLHERILAFFLDFFFMMVLIWLSFWLGSLIFYWPHYSVYFFGVPIFLFYTIAFETFMNGQTPGKKLLKLKVVKITGREAASGDYLLRWGFRMVDIYFSLGAVAAILISSSDRSQRLGDLISNTTVIKLRPGYQIPLSDLLNMHRKSEDYEPQYPEIKYFSEDDVLLIKTVIARARKYKNRAHMEAVSELAEKMSEQLQVKIKENSDMDFLSRLIQDYIALTR